MKVRLIFSLINCLYIFLLKFVQFSVGYSFFKFFPSGFVLYCFFLLPMCIFFCHFWVVWLNWVFFCTLVGVLGSVLVLEKWGEGKGNVRNWLLFWSIILVIFLFFHWLPLSDNQKMLVKESETFTFDLTLILKFSLCWIICLKNSTWTPRFC